MYIDYFGFTAPPFTGSDTEAFFSSSSYDTVYGLLQRGLIEHRSALLLTGEAGVGKSTLLRRLMAELKAHTHCIFIWNANLTFEDLLDYLCDALDLYLPGTQPIQKLQVLTYLISKRAENRGIVLLIDDAQQLPGETLKGLQQLARLETAGQFVLQIILSAHPSLESRLQTEPAERPFIQDLGGHCRLEPLKDGDVSAYIRKRLRAAGYQGEALFEPAALQKIIAYAGGVPRLVNLICNQALALACLNSESYVRAAMVHPPPFNDRSRELSTLAARPSHLGPILQPVNPVLVPSFADTPPKPASEPCLEATAPLFKSDPLELTKTASPNALIALEPMIASPPLPIGHIPHIAAEPGVFPYRSRRVRRPRFATSVLVILLVMAGGALAMRYVDAEQVLFSLARFIEPIAQDNPPAESTSTMAAPEDVSLHDRLEQLSRKQAPNVTPDARQ